MNLKEYWNCDLECTGLIEDMQKQDNPMLHNFGAINSVTGETKLFSRSKGNIHELQAFLDEGHTMAIHNGVCFDSEALEFLGFKVDRTKILDTMALSWYLCPRRAKHGLASWGEEFGVPKPEIEVWQGLTSEEYDHRVIEDCKIQTHLTKHLLKLLNGIYDSAEGKGRLIDHLMWKMEQQRLQQHYRWTLDIEGCKSLISELEEEQTKRKDGLQKSMPPVKVLVKKKRPAKPYIKSGALSAHGIRWKEVCDKFGIDFDSQEEHKVWMGETVEPNAGSYPQIKAWLYSIGWIPETFEYDRNKVTGEVRKIPQIQNDDGICPSIIKLKEKYPNAGLENLEGLGIVNHRLGMVRGFLNNANDDGTITASCKGFTNTLRLKHSGLANLPSTRVPYGERIRRLLTVPDGYENIGSDLSSLEDRCKHHFMWKYDPEYVKMQMHPDFDPHLTVCVMGGLLTEEQVAQHKLYKSGDKVNGVDYSDVRHQGKGANYGCQYGIGIEGLARDIGCSLAIAASAHAGYWKLNWSIKKIANSTTVKHANGEMWQYNPVSKIWYWLKADKDRFSTLCQGLGAYIFDMWLKGINETCKARYGRSMPLVGQFHDECILLVKKGTLPIWHDMLKHEIHELGGTLKLNRDLDCDVQAGVNYAQIH